MKNKIYLFIAILSVFVITTGCSNTNSNNVKIDSSAKESEKAESKKTDVKEVHVGDALKTDDYEITLKSLDFKSEIKYKESKYFSRSVSIDKGKKALALNGIFKNLTGVKIDSYSAIKCKVIIDDKYNYEGSFQSWQDLEPLVEAPIVLYAQVPDSVVESYSKAEFIFGFNDNFESDYDSETEELNNVFKVVLTK